MKYLLLMYNEENAFSEEDLPAAQAEAVKTCHELAAKGEYVDASPLHRVATAKSVRIRDDKPTVTDGPFAETKEQLGGYVLIDADNLDTAIEYASRFPSAKKGTVEIRPLLGKS